MKAVELLHRKRKAEGPPNYNHSRKYMFAILISVVRSDLDTQGQSWQSRYSICSVTPSSRVMPKVCDKLQFALRSALYFARHNGAPHHLFPFSHTSHSVPFHMRISVPISLCMACTSHAAISSGTDPFTDAFFTPLIPENFSNECSPLAL